MAVWVNTFCTSIPEAAIRAGYEADGKPLYIARESMDGVMTPGKCGPHLHGAKIPYGGEERDVNNYEVLVLPSDKDGYYEWKKASYGNVPANAYSTDDGMYIGRAEYSGSLIPGKVHASHQCAYVPYGGKEVKQSHYEVLCKVI
ncbi:natterin-3 [Ostrea edulis]|uniref:natterin-3 n=1 Tax=Ostrea edulis TaxID=37623 RepID=UPI002095A6A1|nr:natterin-3 [Ostrea edulis]